MGNVRDDALVVICAGVHSACVLPLLFILGCARLCPGGRGRAYPFVALIGSITSTNTGERVRVKKSRTKACLYKYPGEGKVRMHIKRCIFLICFLLLAVTGCKKSTTTQLSEGSPAAASPANQQLGEAYFDVCGLITKEQIEAVMGWPIKDTKSSGHSDGTFRISQCFYTAAEFSKSVSLAVTQADPNSKARRSPKDFWEEIFGR